jgi:hypothetical protein
MTNRKAIIATLVRVWKPVLLYILARAALDVAYDTSTRGLELRLQRANELTLWWGIFFSYFVVDLTLLTALVWFFRVPLRATLKDTYSLWDIVLDLAVVTFLMRLTVLLTDPLVFPFVVDLGLRPLHTLLRIAWISWMAVFLFRLISRSRQVEARPFTTDTGSSQVS